MSRRRIQYDSRNDYYKRLGIQADASNDTIQQAYRNLAKKLHPDLNPGRQEQATLEFQQLNEAYAVLSKPELRKEYDHLRWLYGEREPSPQKTRSRTRSRYQRASAQSQDWWNQPDPATYRRTYTPPPYMPPKNAGAWLSRYHLGFLQPFYRHLVGYARSPYRIFIPFIAIMLLLTGAMIVGYGGYLLADAESDVVEEENPVKTIPATSQAVSGNIPEQDTSVSSITKFRYTPCLDSVKLLIHQVENQGDSVRLVGELSLPPNIILQANRLILLDPREANYYEVPGVSLRVTRQWDVVAPILNPDDSPLLHTETVPAGRYMLEFHDNTGIGEPTSCYLILTLP